MYQKWKAQQAFAMKVAKVAFVIWALGLAFVSAPLPRFFTITGAIALVVSTTMLALVVKAVVRIDQARKRETLNCVSHSGKAGWMHTQIG